MRALLRKDLDWLLLFGLGGIIAFTIALGQCYEWWVVRRFDMGPLFYVAWWISAAGFGLFAAIREDLSRTRHYLLHRPIPPTRILTVKLVGCIAVLVSWLVAPLVLVWLWDAIFGYHASFLSWHLIASYLAAGCVMFSFFALGLFVGTLPVAWWLRGLIGGCGGITMLGVGMVLSGADFTSGLRSVYGIHDSMGSFVAWHLVAGAALVGGIYANAAGRDDPDTPWTGRTRAISGSLAVGLVAIAAIWGLAGLQDEWSRSLHRSYPDVRATAAGEVGLFVLAPDSEPRWRRVDGDHTPGNPEAGAREIWSSYALAGYGNFGFDFPRFAPWNREVVHRDWGRSVVLDGSDGLVYVLQRHSFRTDASQRVIGKGPDRSPFSDTARPVDSWRQTSHAFIVEPDREALWYCDVSVADGHFDRISLPRDDRLVDVRSVRPDDDQRRIDDLVYRVMSNRSDALVGENGVYHVAGEAIAAAPEWMVEQVEAAKSGGSDPQVSVTEVDIVAPAIRVTNASDEVLLSHAYAPRTPTEKLYAAMLFIDSALRPPITQVASTVAESDERPAFGANPLLDPLLASGRRLWLTALSIAVGLVSALLARRRLKLLGAATATTRWWFFACLLCGLPAMLLSMWIETRRRYRQPVLLGPDVAPAPLIKSA